MGIEQGKEIPTKGTGNIVNKIISKNFSNLKKEMNIQVQEASRSPNRHYQNRTSPWPIRVQIVSTEKKERILKAVREKNKISYTGKIIKIPADFSTEILKARRAWSEIFWALNENNFSPRILYPAKLSFKNDGAIKIFHNEQKLKQYMTTKPLQKILQEILHTEDESKQNHGRMESIKPQEKKRQATRE
jgi:hypothetical protein